jgi:hypothetical protein
MLLVLWDEGRESTWQPIDRGAKVWPGGQPMWPKALQFVPKVR